MQPQETLRLLRGPRLPDLTRSVMGSLLRHSHDAILAVNLEVLAAVVARE